MKKDARGQIVFVPSVIFRRVRVNYHGLVVKWSLSLKTFSKNVIPSGETARIRLEMHALVQNYTDSAKITIYLSGRFLRIRLLYHGLGVHGPKSLKFFSKNMFLSVKTTRNRLKLNGFANNCTDGCIFNLFFGPALVVFLASTP